MQRTRKSRGTTSIYRIARPHQILSDPSAISGAPVCPYYDVREAAQEGIPCSVTHCLAATGSSLECLAEMYLVPSQRFLYPRLLYHFCDLKSSIIFLFSDTVSYIRVMGRQNAPGSFCGSFRNPFAVLDLFLFRGKIVNWKNSR